MSFPISLAHVGVQFGIPISRRELAPQRMLRPGDGIVRPGREVIVQRGEPIDKALKRLKQPERGFVPDKRRPSFDSSRRRMQRDELNDYFQ